MENNFDRLSSSNSASSISKLIEKINGVCKELVSLLDTSIDNVGNFSVKLTEEKLDTLLVDRVVTNIAILQNHLNDIKKNMTNGLLENDFSNQIIDSLAQTSDNLKENMHKNNFFHNNFGWRINQICELIEKLIQMIPIGLETTSLNNLAVI
ncbi:MAG: hypothetical protein WC872_01705 [Candidatus Absconditabacterales bacterium]